MKTKFSHTGSAAVLLVTLLLLMLPAMLQAQFTFITNNGAITITKYTGADTAIVVPSITNGLPVTRIGDLAFSGCTSLKCVTITESVISIGDDVFDSCSGLTSIVVDTNNPSYSSMAGVLFNKERTALIAYPGGLFGSYAIPNGVTNIGSYAFFYCTWLTSVEIPYGVTEIGDSAFFYCTRLAGLTIPDSVISIGDMALYDCVGLTNVTIGNHVADIGDSAFSFCTGLTNVTIPDSVTTIGCAVFADCYGLVNVTIPKSVTSIGDNAFSWCSSLPSVTVPDSVSSIGELAFGYCAGLTNAIIGNHVTHIGQGAFYNCSLASVTIPGSVTSIEAYAFNCTDLAAAYFLGNAPSGDDTIFSGGLGTAYYLPGAAGWSSTFGGWHTALWYQPHPMILGSGDALGVINNGFGFTIFWATNLPVVVEACTNLAASNWCLVATNTLVNGTSYFTDADWTNYPSRFYRVRSP